jgi:hypothetical protein
MRRFAIALLCVGFFAANASAQENAQAPASVPDEALTCDQLQVELNTIAANQTALAEREQSRVRRRMGLGIGLGILGAVAGGLGGRGGVGAATAAQVAQQGVTAAGMGAQANAANAAEANQAGMLRSQRLRELAAQKQCSLVSAEAPAQQ